MLRLGAMRRAMRQGALLVVVGFAAFVAPAWSAPETRPVAVSREAFLLEYIGRDYENAVRDGQVVNQVEYGELIGFARELASALESVRPRHRAVAALDGVRRLERQIRERVPDAEIWETTRSLSPVVRKLFAGEGSAIVREPNLASGRRLWTNDCAPCHGPSGGGDGRAVPGMDPPPTPFRGRYFDRLSPRHVYETLVLGIDGTAMPSFGDAYDEQQRWDVAFHALTLRDGFAPKRPAKLPELSLEDLAARSNEELLAVLRRTNAAASGVEVDHLRANPEPSSLEARQSRPSGGARSGLDVAVELQDAFSSLAERLSPRVVGVAGYRADPSSTLEQARAEQGDRWVAENEDEVRYPGFRREAAASGILIDREGVVLTCNHLVRDAKGELLPLVDVELENQAHVPAVVLGAEPTLDLAVLRLADPSAIAGIAEPLQIADSDRLQVGHWVVALGDPPGVERVLAVGVVSAPPSRQCYQEQISATTLQTSLAVPATGLCGPVVDIRGRVVGMSVRPRGLSLDSGDPVQSATLPVNLLMTVYEALAAAQSTQSPWLGVSVLELDAARAKLAGGGAPASEPDGQPKRPTSVPEQGLLIDDVFRPSPASAAGVRPGDFLLGLDGHAIRTVADFQTRLYGLGIGKKARLDLLRDGAPLRVEAVIEVRPESATTR